MSETDHRFETALIELAALREEVAALTWVLAHGYVDPMLMPDSPTLRIAYSSQGGPHVEFIDSRRDTERAPPPEGAE